LAHLRKQIRDNVVTSLVSLSTTGGRWRGILVHQFRRKGIPWPRQTTGKARLIRRRAGQFREVGDVPEMARDHTGKAGWKRWWT